MSTLYQAVADQLQELIEQQVYKAGERLPGVRALSERFDVSIATILQAHQLLESRGVVEARERSGHYVRRPSGQAPVPAMVRPDPVPAEVSARSLTIELVHAAQDRRVVPFGAAVPHADFLPLKQIQQAHAWAARRGVETLGYAFPGVMALRRQIAQRMTALGAPVTPDQMIITSGGQECLILAMRAVTRSGDIVAVESPSFPGILQVLDILGLRAIEIPTDPEHGISLDGLRLALEQWPIRACIVVPNHANPLGCRLSDARKQALVSLLAGANVPLIEDDIYGDLPFSGERPRPAKAWDRTGHVIYCGSFSKTISPGLRIGWIEPGRYMDPVIYQKYFMNIASSTVPQLAVAHFLEQGGYERYVRSVRARYEEAVERMRHAVIRYFPEGTAVTRPVGGFVLWVQLPAGGDAMQLYRQARAAHISIAPGPMFTTTGKYRNCLRLNCANPWTDTLERAIQHLGTWASASTMSAHAVHQE